MGAACTAGKLLRLSQPQMENAIGLALSHPPFPMEAGFMGTDAKLVSAAYPALQGLQAARWAKAGAQGAKGLLEPGSEFFQRHSFHDMACLLGGWGERWVSMTISIKKHPGCAYFQGIFDIIERIKSYGPQDIASIKACVNIFAYEANRRSQPAAWDNVSISFSIAKSIALFLHAGELGPRQLRPDYVWENRGALQALADKVCVVHDAGLTRAMIGRIMQAFDLESFLAEFNLKDLWRLREKAKTRSSQTKGALGWGMLLPFIKSRLRRRDFSIKRIKSFDSWEMFFPVRLEVTDSSGRAQSHQAQTHAGSCSDPGQTAVACQKFLNAFGRLPQEKAQKQLEWWLSLESCPAFTATELPRRGKF
ncbi:MAG: MmgE/PrpD family protein [Elusimicrobia bacterium]|nr:MmgE/PrpD family protein [Elusimicrobiota bacterium]